VGAYTSVQQPRLQLSCGDFLSSCQRWRSAPTTLGLLAAEVGRVISRAEHDLDKGLQMLRLAVETHLITAHHAPAADRACCPRSQPPGRHTWARADLQQAIGRLDVEQARQLTSSSMLLAMILPARRPSMPEGQPNWAKSGRRIAGGCCAGWMRIDDTASGDSEVSTAQKREYPPQSTETASLMFGQRLVAQCQAQES
jgi:hypothetical protein